MIEQNALIPAQSPSEDGRFEFLKRLVLDSITSPNSKAQYNTSLDQFYKWFKNTWKGPLVKGALNAYKAHLLKMGLAPSTINCKLAAIKKLTAEAADNYIMPFEIAFSVARVKRVPNLGRRKGVWLDKESTMELLRQPDTSTLLGVRDYAMLCLFIGCGLRRSEVINLRWDRIQMGEGRWILADIKGKGNRIRSVPMPDWAKTAIDNYASAAGIEKKGIVFRRVRSWKRQGERPLTTEAVWNIVRKAGDKVGVHLAPHDLRRTHAKLSYQGGAPLPQIQLSLGHSSLTITQIYLGIDQDLKDAPADHLGINPLPNAPAKPSGKLVREHRKTRAPDMRQRITALLRAGAMSPEDIAEDLAADLDAVTHTVSRYKDLFTMTDGRVGLHERILACLERARTNSTMTGKRGRPRAAFDRAQVEELRAAGLSLRDIAVALGVGVDTLRQVFRSAQ